jgi:hypothetical protein
LHIDRLSITELLEFTIEPIWDLLEQPIEINIHFYCNGRVQRWQIPLASTPRF